MDPNMSPGTDARLKLNLDHGVKFYTKVSIIQPANPKVAQPGAFRPQVSLRWIMLRPTRMPDGSAKKPAGAKGYSKLMQYIHSIYIILQRYI